MDFLSKPSSFLGKIGSRLCRGSGLTLNMLFWASGSSLWRTEWIKDADSKLLFQKVYHFIFREAPMFPGVVFKGPLDLLGSSFRWFKFFQCSVTCKCLTFSFLHMDFECICLSVHYHFPVFTWYNLIHPIKSGQLSLTLVTFLALSK